MDEEHYRKIINSSVHEAFTIFEIDEWGEFYEWYNSNDVFGFNCHVRVPGIQDLDESVPINAHQHQETEQEEGDR